LLSFEGEAEINHHETSFSNVESMIKEEEELDNEAKLLLLKKELEKQ